MKCKECKHYRFYEMITQGPYGYSGKIPCKTCTYFSFTQDNFEPAQPDEDAADKDCSFPEGAQCQNCAFPAKCDG